MITISGTLPPITAPAAECPFRVGDVIRHADNADNWYPTATVTEVGKGTFTYAYAKPVPFIAREGSYFTGGTCFNTAYHHWALVSRLPKC